MSPNNQTIEVLLLWQTTPFLQIGKPDIELVKEGAADLHPTDQVLGVVALVVRDIATAEQGDVEGFKPGVIKVQTIHDGSTGGGRDELAPELQVQILEQVILFDVGIVQAAVYIVFIGQVVRESAVPSEIHAVVINVVHIEEHVLVEGYGGFTVTGVIPLDLRT